MTREEAIELLKWELQTSIDNKEDFADIDGIEKYNESLAMAIKALEQEPNCPYYVIDEDGHGLCKNHRLEQEPILDKIRAEIKTLSNANPSYWHSGDMVEREEVFEIIDNYKAESEDKE